jgi:hypothetical protein
MPFQYFANDFGVSAILGQGIQTRLNNAVRVIINEGGGVHCRYKISAVNAITIIHQMPGADAGWDFTTPVWSILEGIDYPRLAALNLLLVDLDIDALWMYQNLSGQTFSNLTASVSVTDDPAGNSSYSYDWEIILPGDVSLAPVTVAGGGSGDAFWTLAARGCDEPEGLSDSGQTFTVKVTVTGDDYGNTGTAEAEFGIALLGDVNNDCLVDVADRGIIHAFWLAGAAGHFTFKDCNVNCDTEVDVADRGIVHAIWLGGLGQDSVSAACPLR